MERHQLTPLIEALLFCADQPLTIRALVKAVADPDVDKTDVKAVLESLRENYEHAGRGFELTRLGNGYQILTRARYAPMIENLLKTRRRMRLSRAALETVAVVAYKQPLSRMDMERIRGVDVGGVLNTLMERGLIMIKGRDPGPGRPLLYGTTQAFLEYFGLSKVGDLPPLEELTEMINAERPGIGWDESEQARFEKFGIDLESVPTPQALVHPEPEGEALLEADSVEAGEETSAVDGEESVETQATDPEEAAIDAVLGVGAVAAPAEAASMEPELVPDLSENVSEVTKSEEERRLEDWDRPQPPGPDDHGPA